MIAASQFKLLALGAALAFAGAVTAEARTPAGNRTHLGHSSSQGLRDQVANPGFGRFGGHAGRLARLAIGHSGGGIQCVAFARADSGIELSGNANTWWDHAAGLYERGSRPEAGSVLNFRANGVMRMGHVAVVNQVIDDRTIEIDHANWGGPGAGRGSITRDISVVDVSPRNDWSAVRVELGHSGDYGSIYPTFGFIYNRPDTGSMVAANDTPSPMPALNPAPRDLRSASSEADDEVAEAPEGAEPIGGFHHVAQTHRLHHMVVFKSHIQLHARKS